MFKNKQSGVENKDQIKYKKNQYLEMTKDFRSSFPDMIIKEVDGFNVVDESHIMAGFKARAAEYYIQELMRQGVKELVYVQPRRGFAGISLSYLAKQYGFDLTLVMPSSKEVSEHQALCIELGAKPLFTRIAAMPNANSKALFYANARKDATFVPLGLQHPFVTAGAVRVIHDNLAHKENIFEMWSVISTGVLTRALQIALPSTDFHAVAVARNIQQGELGRAQFYSYHKAFNTKSDLIPTQFNCEDSYDSKGWDVMNKLALPGAWFFSVAGNAPLSSIDKSSIDSYRDWNDNRDFEGY